MSKKTIAILLLVVFGLLVVLALVIYFTGHAELAAGVAAATAVATAAASRGRMLQQVEAAQEAIEEAEGALDNVEQDLTSVAALVDETRERMDIIDHEIESLSPDDKIAELHRLHGDRDE